MVLKYHACSVRHSRNCCYTVATETSEGTRGTPNRIMSSLRKFLYRFPRFEAHNRVDFIHRDTILLGYCIEISESGLRGDFSDTAPPGTEGLITLYRDDQSFSAHAKILEVHENEATASFQFQSQQEETAIRDFIRLLAPSES